MSDNAITVRPATLADADIIVEYNQAIAQETEDKALDAATVGAGVRQALEDPGKCRYFIAEVDGVVAGQTMVTVEWSDWRNGYFWWIQSVYVDQRFRRRGVFRKLYDHVRNLAKGDTPFLAKSERDVCGLRLYVDRDNARALETYKSLGMTLTDYLLCEEDWPDR